MPPNSPGDSSSFARQMLRINRFCNASCNKPTAIEFRQGPEVFSRIPMPGPVMMLGSRFTATRRKRLKYRRDRSPRPYSLVNRAVISIAPAEYAGNGLMIRIERDSANSGGER
jgi:hypothetical protein